MHALASCNASIVLKSLYSALIPDAFFAISTSTEYSGISQSVTKSKNAQTFSRLLVLYGNVRYSVHVIAELPPSSFTSYILIIHYLHTILQLFLSILQLNIPWIQIHYPSYSNL